MLTLHLGRATWALGTVERGRWECTPSGSPGAAAERLSRFGRFPGGYARCMSATNGRMTPSFAGRSLRTWSKAVLALITALGPVLLFTGIADAAGNPSVARYLVSNPVPGWSQWPSGSELAASGLQHLLRPEDPGVTVAVGGWLSTSGRLVVMLVVLSSPIGYNPSTGVDHACQGLVHAGAISVHPIPHVQDSEEGVCARKSGNFFVVQAAWSRGSTIVVVTGAGLSGAVVNEICRRQDALLPSAGIHVQSASATTIPASTILPTTVPVRGVANHTSNGVPIWTLLCAGALIVALAVALGVFVVRSRRSKLSIGRAA